MKNYFLNRLQDEGGVALVLSLLIVMTLSALSAGLVLTTLTETQLSSVQLWDTQALFIAEAGLEEVLQRVNLRYPTEVTVNGETFNAAIKDTARTPNADWATRIFLCIYPPPAGAGHVEHTSTIQDQNSWLRYCHPTDPDLALTVEHKLNSDGTIALLDKAPINLVTIKGRKGLAKRKVLAEIYPDRWCPNNALLCQEDLVIGGGPEIIGTVGHVHTNSDLDIGGSPHIGGDATASGAVLIGGTPTIEGDTASGVPEAWIPNVRAEDFLYMCEYILHNDGSVEDSLGNGINPDDLGWKHQGGLWKVTGNPVSDGSFYVEDDVILAGNPGLETDLWAATIIAEGIIGVTGSPFMESYYGGILLVAEGDENQDGLIDEEPVIEIGGNPSEASANYCGAILSAGDLKTKGNPGIEGCLVAEGGIPIGGNPTIIYNGTRYLWPYVRYELCTWREE